MLNNSTCFDSGNLIHKQNSESLKVNTANQHTSALLVCQQQQNTT